MVVSRIEPLPTLLLSSRVANRELAQAAAELGWNAQVLESWRVDRGSFSGPVAAYGEPLFVETVADQLGLELLAPAWDWLVRLPAELRRREIALSSMGAAREIPTPTFVKPVHDKVFRAGIYSASFPLPARALISDDLAVLTSTPVAWRDEFRFFVVDSRPVAGSSYLSHGALAQRPDESWPTEGVEAAEEFARAVCNAMQRSSPPAYVLDVGTLDSGAWAVVEANPAWGSGMCGCDRVGALRCVIRACGATG